MRVQSVNLNLIPTGVMPIVHLSQYDRDADGALLFNIFNGPTPFNLTGYTATINGTKPDGNVYTYPCTVHSNFLTSAVYDQMTTVQGTHEAEIRISDGDSVVGTLNFQMAIEKAGVSEIDVSHTDVPTLLENIQASVDEAEYWAEQAAGAVAGVASFNGRHGSVLPIAGDYDSEKILLASALHIGGETQNNVQEALEALDSKDAGGSFIKVTTSEASLYGDELTLSDGTTTITTNFDSTGHAEFNGVMMTGNLTLTTGSITRTIEVPYFGNYTVQISLWSATIAITTDSPELYGQTITVKDANNQTVATTTFSNSGTASVIVGAQGIYTVHCSTLTPQSVSVTAETTYFVSFNVWAATLNISTSASSLYGQTITITKGGSTVGTTTFSAQGTASFAVHETGEYTCTCEGYSASVTVSAETTYNVTINAGLALSEWITAGSTTEHPLDPTDYANFAALEADEKAVRQLMLVHDAVDYLATASAGDTLMQSVINSDVCVKWINNSDYALDTLSANSDIASEMATADKYGYGEWIVTDSTTTPVTWGAKGNVPIMTANNAPYGTANASSSASSNYLPYKAFTQDYTTWSSGQNQGLNSWLSYTFVTPVKVKRFRVMNEFDSEHDPRVQEYQVIGVNNGAETVLKTVRPDDYTDYEAYGSYHIYFVDIDDDKCDYYSTYKLLVTSVNTNGALYAALGYIQFYGRELTQTLSSAPTDGREYVQIGTTYYTEDWGEKEFESGSTAKWIYDHGVELETLTISGTGTKGSNAVTLSANGATATASITFTSGTWNTLNGKTGLNASGSPRIVCGSGYAAITDRASLDVSAITGANNTGASQTASGTVDIEELWLE